MVIRRSTGHLECTSVVRGAPLSYALTPITATNDSTGTKSTLAEWTTSTVTSRSESNDFPHLILKNRLDDAHAIALAPHQSLRKVPGLGHSCVTRHRRLICI